MSQTYNLDPTKEKKITDRIIAHQLIILETTGNKYIEKIKIREFNDKMDEKTSTIKLSEGNSQPSSLVRPSSLNYKISLSEAVNDFIKKDMPCNDDQVIDVLPEDLKVSATQDKPSSKNVSKDVNHDGNDLDDLMFDMTAPAHPRPVHQKRKADRLESHNHLLDIHGHPKDAWFKEEE